MMATLNAVMLIGRVLENPRVDEGSSGDENGTNCSFRLAVTERDAGGGEQTCTVRVEARRRLGVVCARHVKVGREMFVAGRLRLVPPVSGAAGPATMTVEAGQIQLLGRSGGQGGEA